MWLVGLLVCSRRGRHDSPVKYPTAMVTQGPRCINFMTSLVPGITNMNSHPRDINSLGRNMLFIPCLQPASVEFALTTSCRVRGRSYILVGVRPA